MGIANLQLRSNHQAFVERFVNACQADDRIIAAFLGGSYAKGYADAYSDIDLSVITTDDSFQEFLNARESFLRSLGELVFLEDFDHPENAFYIFADGTEGELYIGRQDQLSQIHAGQVHPLVDKKNILEGAVFAEEQPDLVDQTEKLRGQIQVFWHELSHFVTAMQRGEIWWAQGQLEALRAICINLARLQHNILDPEVGEEPYFKIDKAMPTEPLSPLKDTFVPLEKAALLKAASTIVRYYLDIAPPLAHQHEVLYSQGLERVMMDRFQQLQETSL